jgi:PEP-CTERM motif
MKFSSIIRRAALVMLIASAPAAANEIYDFTFTSGGMDATGTISVNTITGMADGGSINVTGVPLEADPSTLITASGSLLPASGVTTDSNHDGDDIIFDNLVNIANDPILDGNGLGFGSGQYGPTQYNTLINLWGNSPGSYTLFVAEAQLDGNGNVIGDPQWVYNASNGSLTITDVGAAVPEPATYALFGVLAVGCLAMRRRRSCQV